MKRARQKWIVAGLLVVCFAGICLAQPGWRRRGNGGRKINDTSDGHSSIVYTEGRDGIAVDENTVRTAREIASHSTGTPEWTNEPGFERDAFTFARIIYRFSPDGYNPRDPKNPPISSTSSPWGWITDFPDSDLNLSFRVQQMSTIRTDPEGRTLRLSSPDLCNYPWIYMVEVGRMRLLDEEVPILRKYLLNGGVLMVDDFWGQLQWDNFEYQMKRVMPERTFVELPMEHPIFHCVFDIKVPKNKLQTPNSGQGARSLHPGDYFYGKTWEDHDDYVPNGTHDMHVRAMLDDKGRIMVIATHNCDNGDGWEREGEDDGFFHEFSEKRAYPLGINIIFYLMTH